MVPVIKRVIVRSDFIHINLLYCLLCLDMFGEIKRYPVHLNIKKKVFKTRLKDQYLQSWTDDVASNSKCLNYRMFKSNISL